MSRPRLACPGLLVLALASPLAGAPARIDSARGVDRTVDYRVLDRFGPWDDRNYRLTAADLALLAANEAEQSEPIPAFYRVELRRQIPEMRRNSPADYPRSGLPRFLLEHGGYLVDGRLHRSARFDPQVGRWTIRDAARESLEEWRARAAAEAVGGAEIRVTSPNGAAESAIAHHPIDDRIVIAGTNGPTEPQTMHWSSDGGVSWTPVALPLGSTCCDPTVGWSSDGEHAYAATLGWASGFQVLVYRSSNDGQSWNDLESVTPGDPRREMGTNTDKEYLHVDTHAESPCLDDVYLGWQENGTNLFARSTDRAATWSSKLAVSDDGEGEYGFGSDITSDPGGAVYYFWPAYDRRILVAKSTDCGATFAPAAQVTATVASYEWALPSMETRKAWNFVSTDSDRSGGAWSGSVYVAFADTTALDVDNSPELNHSVVKVAYSRDGNAPWTVVSPHSLADSSTVDRWNPWLGVGPDGVVHVAFYDTRHSVNRSGVDLYHARSLDGGQTWSEPERLTSTTSPNISDTFEFGDYNGLSISKGNLLAIFTDNRNEEGPPGESVDVYVAGSTDRIFSDDFELVSLLRWSDTEP